MSLLVGLHATAQRHRDGILQSGVLAAQPQKGRPFGVYTYREDGEFDHPTFSRGHRVVWASGCYQDVWQVAYFGRITPDHYVTNGLVFLGNSVLVTLVTGNNE